MGNQTENLRKTQRSNEFPGTAQRGEEEPKVTHNRPQTKARLKQAPTLRGRENKLGDSEGDLLIMDTQHQAR